MLEIEKRKEAPMLKGEDNFGRGRREAHEGRDATLRRARIEAMSASAVRDRLEKGSPSSARRNFAGMLNELVRDAAGRELPGLAALAEIRKGQKYGYKSRESGTVRDAAGRLIGDGRQTYGRDGHKRRLGSFRPHQPHRWDPRWYTRDRSSVAGALAARHACRWGAGRGPRRSRA